MFFGCDDMEVKILSVIEMGWDRVNARAGARPFHTLSLRLKGSATFYTDKQEPIKIQEGSVTFVPAAYDFRKQAGTGRIIAVHFESDAPLPKEILGFEPENPDRFREDFQRLLQIWTKKDPGCKYEARILFYRIVLEIERQWSQGRSTGPAKQIQPALSYINAHYAESSLSVEYLARLCGMSDTYLRRLFVAECGQTPQRYITGLRLTAATELLRSGYYTVSEIAERCGFNNIHYFSAFIKKETGLSPAAYRKKLLQ